MKRGTLVLGAIVTAVVTQACGGAPPSLKTGISAIERDVQETTPVTLSDLSPVVVNAWVAKHGPVSLAAPKSLDDLTPNDRIVQEVEWAQCQAHTANPLVPVVSGAFRLALQG